MCMYHLAYLLLLVEGCNFSLSTQDALQVSLTLSCASLFLHCLIWLIVWYWQQRAFHRKCSPLAYFRRCSSASSTTTFLWWVLSSHNPNFCQSSYLTAAKHINPVCGKAKIWALLDRIESQLGFHTGDRIRQLQQQVKTCWEHYDRRSTLTANEWNHVAILKVRWLEKIYQFS